MTTPDSLPDDAYEALERLHDDPDERVESLRGRRPDEATVGTQETVFKALGNEARLQVLHALRDGERCVCELQAVLDAPQSTVATHLRKLREAGLVRARKRGRWSYYRVADTAALDLLDLAASVRTEDG